MTKVTQNQLNRHRLLEAEVMKLEQQLEEVVLNTGLRESIRNAEEKLAASSEKIIELLKSGASVEPGPRACQLKETKARGSVKWEQKWTELCKQLNIDYAAEKERLLEESKNGKESTYKLNVA